MGASEPSDCRESGPPSAVDPVAGLRLSPQGRFFLHAVADGAPLPVSRDDIRARLWPVADREPEWALSALKVYLHRARKALAAAGAPSGLVTHHRLGVACTAPLAAWLKGERG